MSYFDWLEDMKIQEMQERIDELEQHNKLLKMIINDAKNEMTIAHERLINCVELFDPDIYETADNVASELLDCAVTIDRKVAISNGALGGSND